MPVPPHPPARRGRIAARVGAVLAAVSCALGLAPGVVAGSTEAVDALADAAPTPALSWSDCGDGFQCSRAKVPLDYRRPAAEHVELAVIRLPATDPGRRVGSLFVNFGGPGASGVDRLRGRARWPWLFSEELRARFDLVSWDPRAVSRSSPVRCFATSAEQQAFFASFPEMPGDPAGEPAFYARSRELVDRCQQRAERLLPHMTTVNTARDLDLLRRAVGERQLTYHGISYGTYVGAVYANLFPGRVRALVFDGSMDFRGNATGHGTDGATKPVDARQDVATGIAETFDAFLRECAKAGPRCAFSAGDVHAKWRTLADRARRAPITITEPDGTATTYTYSRLVNLAADLSAPDDWPGIATTLQRLHDAPDQPTAPPKAPAGGDEPYLNNRTEAFHAIQCADSVVPRDEATYSRLAETEDARVPRFGRIAVFNMMSCASWPAHAVRPYPGPWKRHTANPILVVNSRFDPATPLKGARDGLHQLARARLLVVEGSGHSTMLVPSTCSERVRRDYLVSGTLPPPDATCGVDRGPFDPR
ncbi:alpha/beta hydrolase [Streptoalloteichus hindustanus]|uniref:TAP-like protein n=1 Tax=Streptoalloteichus hindustanus TaxID=2017 RepID=A0A1M5QCY8_STRHI|nr:alpha/beta hydrolase [Streptoalloteichus hindustanus]SHH11383.1 TAP-like protein [Streptoalloteichus hindustanus]